MARNTDTIRTPQHLGQVYTVERPGTSYICPVMWCEVCITLSLISSVRMLNVKKDSNKYTRLTSGWFCFIQYGTGCIIITGGMGSLKLSS